MSDVCVILNRTNMERSVLCNIVYVSNMHDHHLHIDGIEDIASRRIVWIFKLTLVPI